MRKLSPQQRAFLEEATAAYEAHADDVLHDYLLRTRGSQVASRAFYYRLGRVVEPLDGHERFVGRMCLPYVTPSGVVDLRFRCIQDHDCKQEGCAKYLSIHDSRPTLFNTRSFSFESPIIVLTEGEFDAMAVELTCSVPTIAYPGVATWGKHRYWRRCFAGYQSVFVIADGDSPGRDAAEQIVRDLPNGKIVSMPDGMDATEFLMDGGRDALMGKLGLVVPPSVHAEPVSGVAGVTTPVANPNPAESL